VTALVPASGGSLALAELPAILAEAGPAAAFAWDEWMNGTIRNVHTRRAYGRAVRDFFRCIPEGTAITAITPGQVGRYLSQHPGTVPTRKLALAALRACFDVLVQRHVMVLNPASSVRGERYSVVEGKTPEISIEQARLLLNSVETATAAGRRDKAILGILIYTGARVGAVARLQCRSLVNDGSQWLLRFDEKGGKAREIPVRHDLEHFLLDHLAAAGLTVQARDIPLFQTIHGRTGQFTGRALTGLDINRMVKRRLRPGGSRE